MTVQQLTVGSSYALLLFNDTKWLPVNGSFLTAPWAAKHPFVANASSVVFNTPEPLWSNGTYFYRCVAVTNGTAIKTK